MVKSFSVFFKEAFLNDRAYEEFLPNHFKRLYEMAHRHDVVKQPVNFDEDDIEFLNQFPHNFWAKAKHMRYNMLFDAVEKLHKQRKAKGHGELKDALIQAMQTQNWSGLKGMMPDGKIARLSNHLNSRLVKQMSKKELEKEADKISHEQIKLGLDDVEDPEQAEFSFKDKEAGPKGMTTYMAKPYLNRLYHKLERTKGLPHTPSSGLSGEAKYGYDMAEPLRSPDEKYPHTTDGIKFPTPLQISGRMKDFLNIQAHRIFGTLPEDAKWLPTGQDDNWSIEYVENEIRKKIESSLRLNGKHSNNKDLEKDARAMAKTKVLEMAKTGQLKGPPIPGVFPDGIPIRVETKKGKEQLIPPPLYLPHVLKTLQVKGKDGRIKQVQKEVPVVNPAHFFRELGSHDSDYATKTIDGKEVRQYNSDGSPIYNVPKDKLRGHESQFVHVGDDEFTHGKHRAAGAIDFNHNSEGISHITRGDEGYDEAYDKVFGSQRKVIIGKGKRLIPTEGSGYFEDIMKGILSCATGTMCGGATSHERTLIIQNAEDVHQIIFQRMLMDLRNPKLHNQKDRVLYAKNKTGSYAQRDQQAGGGTRRLRSLKQSGRNSSLDMTVQGSEGGTMSVSDKLMSKMKDKDKLSGDSDGGPTRLLGKTKVLDTSGQNAPYNLANFREIMKELHAMAQESDQESEEAKSVSKREVGQHIVDMLQKGMKGKAEVTDEIRELLKNLYVYGGSKEDEALSQAERQIKSWVEDGVKSSDQMFNAFKTHPLVQSLIGDQASSDSSPSRDQNREIDRDSWEKAMQKVHQDFQNIRNDGRTLDQYSKVLTPDRTGVSAYVRSSIAPMFGEVEHEALLPKVQQEINKMLASSQSAKTTQAAKLTTMPLAQLYKDKNYIAIASNHEFLSTAGKQAMTNLLAWVENNKTIISQEDYNRSISNLKSAMARFGV